MLFASVYTYRPGTTEATLKRVTDLFVNWQPPKGYTFKAHYLFADGSGGVTLAEAESEAVVYEAAAPWIPFLELRINPVVEIEKGVEIALRAIAWRESVKDK
jgi:hypothetical protein